jgi:hypothetical protein
MAVSGPGDLACRCHPYVFRRSLGQAGAVQNTTQLHALDNVESNLVGPRLLGTYSDWWMYVRRLGPLGVLGMQTLRSAVHTLLAVHTNPNNTGDIN